MRLGDGLITSPRRIRLPGWRSCLCRQPFFAPPAVRLIFPASRDLANIRIESEAEPILAIDPFRDLRARHQPVGQ